MAGKEVRGEIDIAFAGETFVLRPTREAIRTFERLTGKSLLQLAEAAGAGSMVTDDMAAVVTECIKAWGKATGNATAQRVNADRIGDLLQEYGILIAVKRLELMLFLAATGGYTASGEPKAIGTPMTETPIAA